MLITVINPSSGTGMAGLNWYITRIHFAETLIYIPFDCSVRQRSGEG